MLRRGPRACFRKTSPSFSLSFGNLPDAKRNEKFVSRALVLVLKHRIGLSQLESADVLPMLSLRESEKASESELGAFRGAFMTHSTRGGSQVFASRASKNRRKKSSLGAATFLLLSLQLDFWLSFSARFWQCHKDESLPKSDFNCISGDIAAKLKLLSALDKKPPR